MYIVCGDECHEYSLGKQFALTCMSVLPKRRGEGEAVMIGPPRTMLTSDLVIFCTFLCQEYG
jgi:hypothetical protein